MVMMSKQYKLYPALIWNGENRSLYTVFFKKRVINVFPPLQELYSGGKKIVILVRSLIVGFLLKDFDLKTHLLFNKVAHTPSMCLTLQPSSLWDRICLLSQTKPFRVVVPCPIIQRRPLCGVRSQGWSAECESGSFSGLCTVFGCLLKRNSCHL